MGDCGWLLLPALMVRVCGDSGTFVRRFHGVSRKECEIDQCASKSIIKSNQIQGASPPSVFVNRSFLQGLPSQGRFTCLSLLVSL